MSSPVTPENRAALNAIGIDEDWQEDKMTNEDAIQVLAFHKFLSESDFSPGEDGTKAVVTQAGFDYCLGKITAEAYLNSPPKGEVEENQEEKQHNFFTNE